MNICLGAYVYVCFSNFQNDIFNENLSAPMGLVASSEGPGSPCIDCSPFIFTPFSSLSVAPCVQRAWPTQLSLSASADCQQPLTLHEDQES